MEDFIIKSFIDCIPPILGKAKTIEERELEMVVYIPATSTDLANQLRSADYLLLSLQTGVVPCL